ncbi:heavy-metal-associated domain-containing protein [Humisphaera borealis]|uniref:Heavy-metal-associated domain-containing protein n=1 Tax=Humisphaera borealis TaxID=2807512 RepID=A0A7M2X3J9_9BACT|nr:heavy metal-associated domain-containing protein [Humisphaera borealis]QOV92255.1 heavy-metal-associated domain-containing protein [Humisphaera borealis]
MSTDVSKDQLVLIAIQGMHCHKCEIAITKALSAIPGVFEVEVDFNSGQASVLFDASRVQVSHLVAAVNDTGYQTTGFTQREAV